jgi:glutathione synthase
MSATYQIDVNNWREVVAKIATDKIVLKPLSGAGGKGIVIVDKNNFDISMLHTKITYIAQDFVDSSQGIPGICEGYHDLRILMFNGRPTLSFVRTAKTGSLLSNVSQGASAAVLEITDIPQEILDIAHRVDSELLHYNHRFYSSDFFMSNGKPYLVEINSMPGFPQLDVEGLDFAEKFFDNLYDLLNNALMQSEK